MTFVHPVLLLLLLLVPALVLFKLIGDLRSRRALDRLVASRLRRRLVVPGSSTGQWSIFLLECLGIALLIVALARPQWGVVREESEAEGRDIMIAIDTSKSMLATDLPPATRLERARLAAQDLIRSLPEDRFGLVAFAGRAFMQAPLTIDHEAIDESLAQLDTEIIPRGGTNLAEAITAAAEAFRNSESAEKALIVFSDGDALEGAAIDAAKDAAESGIMIVTVGVGTPGGAIVEDPEQPGRYIANEGGEVVRMQLQRDALQELARLTRGIYVEMGPGRDVRKLLIDALQELSESAFATRESVRPIERFQWFLGGAILSWTLAILLPALLGLGANRTDSRPVARPAAPAAGRRPLPASVVAGAILVVGAWCLPSPVDGARDPGFESYSEGRFSEAIERYESRIDPPKPAGLLERLGGAASGLVRRLSPSERDVARLSFGLGGAAYREGDYERAAEAFGRSLLSPNPELQEDSHYNLGNTLFRKGQLAQEEAPDTTIQLWKEAIAHYEAALEIDPNNKDAEFNRDFVRQLLEQLEQQQQQQQQQQQGQGEGDPSQQQQDGEPSEGGQPQDGGQQPQEGDQEQQGDQGQDGEEEGEDGKGKDNPEQQDGGGEGGKEEENLEGKLEAQDNQRPSEDPGEGDDQQSQEAEAREGDDGVNPETGFSRSQARQLLRNLADEDLGARPRMRVRNEKFQDW